LSNGPGDPEPLAGAIQVAKEIIENNKPLFGICLGHQVIDWPMEFQLIRCLTDTEE
jgi:carbamoylphosphate synthase small subunit